MKSYDERIESIFSKYNSRLAEKERRATIIKRISLSISSVCAAVIIGVLVLKSGFTAPDRYNGSESSGIITATESISAGGFKPTTEKKDIPATTVRTSVVTTKETQTSSATTEIVVQSITTSKQTQAFQTRQTIQAVNTTEQAQTTAIPTETSEKTQTGITTTQATAPKQHDTSGLNYGNNEDYYYYRRNIIDEQNIDSYLKDTSLYLVNNDTQTISDCSVYKISGISDECGIAVKTEDKYRIAWNPSFHTETFNDISDALSFESNYAIESAVLETNGNKNEINTEKIGIFLDSIKNEHCSSKYIYSENRVIIRYRNQKVQNSMGTFILNSNGYISISLTDNVSTLHLYIGEEKAQNIIDILQA